MADVINKAKKRNSANNKARYAAQYTKTYKNKARAINKHIEQLKMAEGMLPPKGMRSAKDLEKAARINHQMEMAKAALASIPLKKGG